MSEARRIAEQLDKIYDTDMTNRLVASLASSSKFYTLDELEQLARQWRDSMGLYDKEGEKDLSIPLVLSIFLKWLRKREREVGDVRV